MIATADPENFKKWCEANGNKPVTQATLDEEDFRNVVWEDVCKLAKANKLNSLETPKQFSIK